LLSGSFEVFAKKIHPKKFQNHCLNTHNWFKIGVKASRRRATSSDAPPTEPAISLASRGGQNDAAEREQK
jgi:hypothetical protein